ncbi:MAG: peptidoglycan DD-metalloendopeptidase family protein [Oscillospiraceae bacterium]|nr:peptidoglycan DD-metalloendopeptidase family protein [Oscillospiraceae bacterium]
MHMIPDAYNELVEYLMAHTVNESKDFCGYPTQEYFKEETETVTGTETETVEQWTDFPEVIHLPMLEEGGYIWPAGPGVRISRGFSDGSRYPLIPVIENSNIKSINRGKVTDIYSDKEYGKVIVIESYVEADGAYMTIHYPYCKELLVQIGEEVESGQNIAVLSEQVNEEEYRCQAGNTIHKGIDIAGPYGTDILASADGKVIKAEESSVGNGNYVVIEHKNGYFTLYAHCSELLVKEGDEVEQGEVIAKMGSTGNSTGNHLHFEFGFGYGSEPEGGLRLDPYSVL